LISRTRLRPAGCICLTLISCQPTDDANFVVTTTQDGPAFDIPPAWIFRTFGPPVHTYHDGVWTIMTYRKNLLDEVSARPGGS
jgi:hypothetical protein